MNPLVKVSLRYGAIAGIIGSGLLIALYYMDRHPMWIPPYADFSIILFGLIIFFALREFRDYHQNGVLYFWQGLIASFLVTVCYAAITAVAMRLFAYAEPGFVSRYVEIGLEYLRALPAEEVDRIGRDEVARNIETLPSTDAAQFIMTYCVRSFAISFFISIILSVTLRREPKP